MYLAWQFSFALSYKWCYNEKRLKPWWYPTLDNSPQDFLANRKHPVHVQQFGAKVYSIRVSLLKKKKKGGGWWYVETFNNMIFSKYLVTNTDPMELNKGYRHSNWSMTISVIDNSYVVTCHVYSILRNEGRVFQNEILTLRIHSSTGTFWKLNCHVLYFKLFSQVSITCLCFVNTAVLCQLCSSTKLILLCFQNIILWKRSMCTRI
jgi:hypothetical protein